jgi:hypothetical protein
MTMRFIGKFRGIAETVALVSTYPGNDRHPGNRPQTPDRKYSAGNRRPAAQKFAGLSARRKAEADRIAKNIAPIILEIASNGVASHRGIARSLNARGGAWTAVQVGAILQRVEA